ncbi:MAG: Rieske (2Fe-2S) protein [Elusimicrobia bacterium]|nr:Rieske (2Fe-2S) protein [Elusimicrobiota bacterium]
MDEPARRWVRACPASALAPRGVKRLELEGAPVLLLEAEGRYFACADRCPHLGVSLEKGEVAQGAIRCGAHGYRMDLATGECRTEKGLRLPVFPVELRDGWLWLAVG